MAETLNPKSGEYCPMHTRIEGEVKEIQTVQKGRPCQTNTEKIANLERDKVDQWTSINQLHKLVYMGAGPEGVLAFLGSILGAVLKK